MPDLVIEGKEQQRRKAVARGRNWQGHLAGWSLLKCLHGISLVDASPLRCKSAGFCSMMCPGRSALFVFFLGQITRRNN